MKIKVDSKKFHGVPFTSFQCGDVIVNQHQTLFLVVNVGREVKGIAGLFGGLVYTDSNDEYKLVDGEFVWRKS